MKVLFLPAWYPHRRDAMCGLFVRKHAQAVARYADVCVLYIQNEPGLKRPCFETRRDAHLTEYYLYYPSARTHIGAWYRKAVALYRLWRAYKRENGLPDLVHVHVLTWPLWMACWLKGRYRIPFVATEHWSRYMRGLFKDRILRRATASNLRRASAVMPVSEALGQAMRDCGLPHPVYRVVRNVVDDFFFENQSDVPASDSLYAAMSSRPNPFVHICCFDEQAKNNFGLLRAVAALKRKRTDFTLYMVGNGKDWEATRAYAAELGLQDTVVFTGEVPPLEVKTVLTAARFSVLFSRYETASVVVAESLAAGRPVLCSAIPAIVEVMDDHMGRMVPVADEAALTDALDWMLDHADRFDGAALQRQARPLFAAEYIGRRFMEIYQTAVSH